MCTVQNKETTCQIFKLNLARSRDVQKMIDGKPSSSERTPAFYKVVHVPTEMEYAGSTKNVYLREAVHRSRLKRGVHPNKDLQKAYDSDPNISFHYEPTETQAEASAKEQQYLTDNKDSGKLFNKAMDVNAPGKGVFPNEETRKKISEAGLGRKHTEETRVQMSNSSLGKNAGITRSDAHRAAVSNRHKGVPLSDEHKEKAYKARQLVGNSVIVIDDKEYASKTEAAIQLGICRPTVTARVNNPRFPNWSIKVFKKEENE